MKRKAFKAFLMRGEWFREGIGSFFYRFAFYWLVLWGALFILVDFVGSCFYKNKIPTKSLRRDSISFLLKCGYVIKL